MVESHTQTPPSPPHTPTDTSLKQVTKLHAKSWLIALDETVKSKQNQVWTVNNKQILISGGFFVARILGGRFIDSFPTCPIFSFLNGDQLVHTNSTLYARIGPQWLSELRRLWPSVPWHATSLFSLLILMLCLDSIVSLLRLPWVKDICMFRCNLPLALLTE